MLTLEGIDAGYGATTILHNVSLEVQRRRGGDDRRRQRRWKDDDAANHCRAW